MSATSESISLRRQIPLLASIALWILIYHRTIAGILSDWLTENQYSHGYLSLCLAIYIGWRQRERIAAASRVDWTVIGLILIVSIACWMGQVANVLKIQQLGVYLLFVLVFVAICGRGVLRTLLIPFLILSLTIPVWDFFEVPLQDWSTIVALHTIRILGVPAIRDGYEIAMPGGSFVVEPACGGLGFFLTAVTLSVFYTYLASLSWGRGVLLAMIAAAIAILSNWIRVVVILLVGDETYMQSPIVSNHLTFGWILFAVALVPFFYICHRWFRGRLDMAEAINETTWPPQSYPVPGALIVIMIALAVVPVAGFILKMTNSSARSVALTLPQSISQSMATSGADAGLWSVSFPGAAKVLKSSYVVDGRNISVLVVLYEKQEQGRELVNVNNRLTSPRWNRVSDREVSLDHVGSVRVRKLSQGMRTRSLVYWYVIGGHATSNAAISKLLEVYGALNHNTSAALVVLDLGESRVGQSEFLRSVLPIYKWSLEIGR